MNLYVKNNPFWFELENLTRLYFPNEKITVYKEFDSVEKPFVYTEVFDEIRVRVSIGAFDRELTAALGADKNETELHTVQLLYRLLRDFSGVSQPWGLLTGVRPIKLLRKQYGERGREEAIRLVETTELRNDRVLVVYLPDCHESLAGIIAGQPQTSGVWRVEVTAKGVDRAQPTATGAFTLRVLPRKEPKDDDAADEDDEVD